MSLRTKFGLLLAFLALTLLVNAGVAAWAVRTTEVELDRPLVSVDAVLRELARAKRAIGAQHNMIARELAAIGPRPEPGETDFGSAIERQAAIIDSALARLDLEDVYRLRSGIATTRNLRERTEAAEADIGLWLEGGDEEARARATANLFNLHELIERIEARIVEDVLLASSHIGVQRSSIRRILLASGIAVLIACGLGLKLVQRWVLSPVAALRKAAEKIAAGDFTHRLEAGSRDELGLLSEEVNHMSAMVVKLQEERVERERLAAIGEMARRIVHHLRTPLSGIRGLAELTRAEFDPSSDLAECQGRIIQTVDRADSWLQDLLRHSRPLELRPDRQDVASWLERVVESRRPRLEARGLSLRMDLAPDLGAAMFDPVHLEHAVAALVDNAIHAAPDRTEVAIEAGSAGGRWHVRVRNEGPGISEEVRRNLFRPYFTTRASGTGMGLAVAQQVAKAHGGLVRLLEGESDHGAGPGTTFEVDLPLEVGVRVASEGQNGVISGQDSGHRR